jgi:O-antigen/teichoic acid export membrane protein
VAAAERRSFAAGARVLGAGVGAAGVLTFVFFGMAGHALGDDAYARLALLWTLIFTSITVLYRPVEQFLTRAVAAAEPGALRRAAELAAAFAVAFAVAAVALRGVVQGEVLGDSATLWWVWVVAVIAYAGSFLARGWCAGHGRVELYGALLLVESGTRVVGAVALVAGLASGLNAWAVVVAIAPFVTLAAAGAIATQNGTHGPVLRRGGAGRRRDAAFASGALGVQLAEQALVGGIVLVADAVSNDPAVAGYAFNVLLIARAPLVLFQAVQATLLPHLTRGGDAEAAIRPTLLLVAGFAALAALGLLLLGPLLLEVAFGDGGPYTRGGLALVAVGMGFHLIASTLTQRALAEGRAARAAVTWLAAATVAVVFVALPLVDDVLLRVEVAYVAATALLAAAMAR